MAGDVLAAVATVHLLELALLRVEPSTCVTCSWWCAGHVVSATAELLLEIVNGGHLAEDVHHEEDSALSSSASTTIAVGTLQLSLATSTLTAGWVLATANANADRAGCPIGERDPASDIKAAIAATARPPRRPPGESMKIKIEVDTTPEELRRFFGLPDVSELQSDMLSAIRDKMRDGAEGYDPFTLMRPFLPENLQSLETLQRAFWDNQVLALLAMLPFQ